ncbi:hypothetical protein GEMRC1_003939 [Eukaryota sp. GEM-RC1]
MFESILTDLSNVDKSCNQIHGYLLTLLALSERLSLNQKKKFHDLFTGISFLANIPLFEIKRVLFLINQSFELDHVDAEFNDGINASLLNDQMALNGSILSESNSDKSPTLSYIESLEFSVDSSEIQQLIEKMFEISNTSIVTAFFKFFSVFVSSNPSLYATFFYLLQQRYQFIHFVDVIQAIVDSNILMSIELSIDAYLFIIRIIINQTNDPACLEFNQLQQVLSTVPQLVSLDLSPCYSLMISLLKFSKVLIDRQDFDLASVKSRIETQVIDDLKSVFDLNNVEEVDIPEIDEATYDSYFVAFVYRSIVDNFELDLTFIQSKLSSLIKPAAGTPFHPNLLALESFFSGTFDSEYFSCLSN